MRYPSDGEAWKHFDQIHTDFAAEPRNVRLGLCSDDEAWKHFVNGEAWKHFVVG